MNKVFLTLSMLLFSLNIYCKTKVCDCEIYDKTLKALNDELGLIKETNGYLCDSIDLETGMPINPVEQITYYGKTYHQKFKFIISDVILKPLNPNFINKTYNELANDSIKEKLSYKYSDYINLKNCKFNKSDSIFVMNLENMYKDNIDDSIYDSFTKRIKKHTICNDTTVYISNIISFSKITYLGNDLALLDIITGSYYRKYNRYLLFKRVKNKWILVKLGDRIHMI